MKKDNYLHDICFQPLAICDGDTGSTMEEYFEKFFKSNGIKYKRCYNLYKKPKDLSKYKTIAFFTTNAKPEKVKKIMEFDMSNVKTVIIMGEWAYDLCSPICEKLGIKLYVLDRLQNKIVEAKEYFSY